MTDSSQPTLNLDENDMGPVHNQEQQLVESLIAAGKLGKGDLERASQLRQSDDEHIDSILVRQGLVSEQDVAETLAAQLSFPLAERSDYPDMPVLEEQLSFKFLKQHNVVPLAVSEDEVQIAIADPLDGFAINAIKMFCEREVRCRVGLASDIQDALERLYGAGKTQMAQIVDDVTPADSQAVKEEIAHLKDLASEAPVIRLVNLIMQRAVEERASDIHIEPFEHQLKVRYRIDGILHEYEAPPMQLYAAMVSRIKIMAKLDIAERRLPQDGRLMVHIEGKEIDVRVSTVPTMYGESVVMRLLYKEDALLDLNQLGFSDETLARFMEVLHMPYGILLVTGPTGSGKTTTLYTALNLLNDPGRKIMTVEDPVEYQLNGINQIQVKPQIDLTFARVLRSIVRQDPDVIMIGEMRDLETAEIAVQSALTGHLVLSTLHTNDAASSITRLLDMGMEGYLVTSVVNGVLAQRLVRRLCPHCQEAYEALPELVNKTNLGRLTGSGQVTLYRPKGCEHCNGSGYRGRVAIMEMLVMSDQLRSLVLQHAHSGDIGTTAVAEGMRTMYEDGLQKALQGVTSLEEVLRVTKER